MDYKKEELTEYNGERGYWRTINGRKIFISIEDTKKERKDKIKNFIERKQSNIKQKAGKNNIDETNEREIIDRVNKMTPEQIRKEIQKNIDEANAEVDRKQNSAREKYIELRDKLQDKNLSQEERDKIKEHMDTLVLFHGKRDRKRLERELTKKEPSNLKISSTSKNKLEEKTNELKEDAMTRRTMTDPYIKHSEKVATNFDSKIEQERYYSNLRKEVINYFETKGKKYRDDYLIQNAEQLADKYIKERRRRLNHE